MSTIKTLIERLRADLSRQSEIEGGPKELLFCQGTWATVVYRVGEYIYERPRPAHFLPAKLAYKLASKAIEVTTGISIPASVRIGPGLYIGHFGEIIIHSDAKIGERFSIGQGVTIGTKGQGGGGVPVIGDDVYLGVGSKVLGGIVVGDNVSVGANAVVVKDVPAGSVAVGVPARVLPKRRGEPRDG